MVVLKGNAVIHCPQVLDHKTNSRNSSLFFVRFPPLKTFQVLKTPRPSPLTLMPSHQRCVFSTQATAIHIKLKLHLVKIHKSDPVSAKREFNGFVWMKVPNIYDSHESGGLMTDISQLEISMMAG